MPNTTFWFAVGWRDEADTNSQTTAINWLKAGLENLGAGAKTSAGYGYFGSCAATVILSAVLSLTPTLDMPIPASLGHKAQGWLLNEVHKYLPSLAERLHQQGGYTVSGVHRQLKGKPGKYYLRVTSLVSDLTDVLLEAVLPNTQTISFSPRKDSKQPAAPEEKMFPDFEVNGYATNASDHPLAGITSFAALVQSAERNDTLRITFLSPTAFGSNGIDQPLPSPALILRSRAEKWNTFAPTSERLGYPIQQFSQDFIQIIALSRIHTTNWYLPNKPRQFFLTR